MSFWGSLVKAELANREKTGKNGDKLSESQACGHPAPLNRFGRDAEQFRRFRMCQPLVPEQVDNLALLLRELRDGLMEVGPRFEISGLVACLGLCFLEVADIVPP